MLACPASEMRVEPHLRARSGNADIQSLEAILVEEQDPHVNALGIKGVGEIGITGTAGATPMRCGTRRGFGFAGFDHLRAADRSRTGLGKCDRPAGNRDLRIDFISA